MKPAWRHCSFDPWKHTKHNKLRLFVVKLSYFRILCLLKTSTYANVYANVGYTKNVQRGSTLLERVPNDHGTLFTHHNVSHKFWICWSIFYSVTAPLNLLYPLTIKVPTLFYSLRVSFFFLSVSLFS